MKRNLSRLGLLAVMASLAACASVPSGPSMLVLPGTGRSFDQFRADDGDCRAYASYQIGGQTTQGVAQDSGVRSAALGTVVGAVAGAAVGGQRGAAVGAGSGLLLGTAAGTGAGQQSAYDAQRRYDHAYVQCMYAKGHRVPVSGQLSGAPRAAYPSSPVPPPAAGVAEQQAQPVPLSSSRYPAPPPPPPGNPPPPPPGVRAN